MHAPQTERTTLYAWSLLLLLTLLNTINFVDRQLIVSLQVPLKADELLQLDDEKIALLAGYAFAVVYSIAGLYLGTIADRWHRPRLIAVGLLMWSAMTAASGLAQSFSQLALARVLVAIGEATLTPASVAMLGDVFDSKRRSLASGLYYLGIPLGASLSLIVASVLEPMPGVGWRGCFLGLGGVGVALVFVVGSIRDPRQVGVKKSAAPPRAAHPSLGSQLRAVGGALRSSPALTLTMIGGIAINVGVGTTWLDVSWLVAERGFDKSQATMFLGVCLLLGGSLGNFLGGWLGDLFHRRYKGGRLLALVAIQLAITPIAMLFRFVSPDSILFPLGCFCGSITITMMYGPVLASVQELTPVRIRATMIAFLMIGLNIFGASLGALVAARMVGYFKLSEPLKAAAEASPGDAYLGSYTWGIFLTAQVSLLAIPLFLIAARRFQKDLAAVQLRESESIA